jgi:hypothetical protein
VWDPQALTNCLADRARLALEVIGEWQANDMAEETHCDPTTQSLQRLAVDEPAQRASNSCRELYQDEGSDEGGRGNPVERGRHS